MSSEDDSVHGVGAARAWLFQQFQNFSPRLQVSYNKYRLKKIDGKNSRVPRDVDLYNIIAVLPGKGDAGQRILITAHYDTLVTLSETGANASGVGETVPNPDLNTRSPGVTDDGSGVACVMELARILSQFEFKKTLVFVAFAGEEEGLLGSTLYAARTKADRQHIEAVLNNDIIGSAVAGDGARENSQVRVFSDDPPDSPSRTLGRYVRDIGQTLRLPVHESRFDFPSRPFLAAQATTRRSRWKADTRRSGSSPRPRKTSRISTPLPTRSNTPPSRTSLK